MAVDEAAPKGRWFDRTSWRLTVIGIPYAWLILFCLLPFLIVLAMSLARQASTSPPFAFSDAFPFIDGTNFTRLTTDTLYVRAFLTSLKNAAIATFFCLLIGYPMALAPTRSPPPGAISS